MMTLAMLTAGTIAEQRARLPPPADCTDPVAGVWKSHDYFMHVDHWYLNELHIERVAGSDTELTGRIEVEMWLGNKDRVQPPADCSESTLHYLVEQDARGVIKGTEIQFGGLNYRLKREICGNFNGYNEDHFAGTIDPELSEFQTLNNDGGIAVNFPSVFRRVKCTDSPADEPVEPPPFQPPKGVGCSLW